MRTPPMASLRFIPFWLCYLYATFQLLPIGVIAYEGSDDDVTLITGIDGNGSNALNSLDESQTITTTTTTTEPSEESTAFNEASSSLVGNLSDGGVLSNGLLSSEEGLNNFSFPNNGSPDSLTSNTPNNAAFGFDAVQTGNPNGSNNNFNGSPVGSSSDNTDSSISSALPGPGAQPSIPTSGSAVAGGNGAVGNNGSSGTGLLTSANGPNSQSNGSTGASSSTNNGINSGQGAPGLGGFFGGATINPSLVPLTGGDAGSIFREFPFSKWTAANTYFEPNVPTEGGVSPFPYFPRGTPYYQPTTANKKTTPNKSLLAAAIISLICGLLLVSAFTAFLILRRRRQMSLYIERDFGNLSSREAGAELPESVNKTLPTLSSSPPQIAPIQRMSNLGGAVFPMVIPIGGGGGGEKFTRSPSGVMPGEETHTSVRIPPSTLPSPTTFANRKPLTLASSQYLAAPSPQSAQQMQSLRNAKRLSRPSRDGEPIMEIHTPKSSQIERPALPPVVSAAPLIVPTAAAAAVAVIAAPVPRRKPLATEFEERLVEEDFAKELALKRHLTSTPIEDEEVEEEEGEGFGRGGGRGGGYMDESEGEEQSFSAAAASLIKGRVEHHKLPREVIEEVYEYEVEEEEEEEEAEIEQISIITSAASSQKVSPGLGRREKVEVYEIEEEEEETTGVVSSSERRASVTKATSASMQSRTRSGTMSSSQSRARSGTETSQASRVVQSEIVEEYFIEEEVTASDSEEEEGEPKIIEEIVVQDDQELQAYLASVGIGPTESTRTPSSVTSALSRPLTGAATGTTFTSDASMHEEKS